MASALQVMALDEFWLLLKGNEGRGDVARAMAADDYAEELLGGDELLAYEFLAECDGRPAGTWQACDGLGVDVALWRGATESVAQGFLFGVAVRHHSRLPPAAAFLGSETLLGMARLLALKVGTMRLEYGVKARRVAGR